MAHFYATARGRANTPAGRIGTKKTGCRATVASYTLGASCYIDHFDPNGDGGKDIVTVKLDGGSGGPAEAGGLEYEWQDGEPIVRPEVGLMLAIPDAWWTTLMDSQAFAEKIKRVAFMHLDKLP